MKKSKNFLFITLILITAVLLTQGPDLVRNLNTPPDKWFTGQASWFDPWDINLYLSAIGWGRRAGILFENLYDTTSKTKMPIFFLYTALGKLSAPLNLSNPLIFHLGAVLGSVLLAGVVWWLLSIFLRNAKEQKAAFALIFLGGGLGWLFFPNWVLPDVGTPGFTFQNALRMPREALSVSLLLFSLGNFWQGTIKPNNRFFILGTLSTFVMMLFHPYNLISLATVFLVFGIYHWLKTGSRNFLKVLTLLAITGWFYYLLLGKELLTNPSFAGQAGQNQPSPSLILMILGWGSLFPLILLAFWQKSANETVTFLKIWFIAHLVTLYLPFHFQKLLIRGLWVPAVILAVLGLREVFRRIKWNYYLTALLLIVISSLSTFYMAYKRITETSENRWIYLTQEESAAMHYLKAHGQDEEGVLASYRLANIIPAHTAKKVYAGHEFQTPNFQERIQQVNRFYAGQMSEEETKEFLEKAGATWIFWGPDEKAVGNLTDFPYRGSLETVLENQVVSLYQKANN